MINKVIDRFRRWGLNGPKILQVKYTSSFASVPDNVRRWEMWVVGTSSKPKWAVLACPCGLGHTIKVSLQKNHNPHWELTVSKGVGPSLSPSIDMKDKPFCHFWLRNGKVEWVHKGRGSSES